MPRFVFLVHAEGYEGEEEFDHITSHGVWTSRANAQAAATELADEAHREYQEEWDGEADVTLEWEEDKGSWLVQASTTASDGEVTWTESWVRFGVMPLEVKD